MSAWAVYRRLLWGRGELDRHPGYKKCGVVAKKKLPPSPTPLPIVVRPCSIATQAGHPPRKNGDPRLPTATVRGKREISGWSTQKEIPPWVGTRDLLGGLPKAVWCGSLLATDCLFTDRHRKSQGKWSLTYYNQGCGVGVETGDGVGRSRPFWFESKSELESVKKNR